MGRRYYCDYCDKRFNDDLDSRKKHLASAHHLKMRKLHFETHKDPKLIFEEEVKKIPCRRFLHSGSCQFAANCKYSHYTKAQLWEMKQQIEEAEWRKHEAKSALPELPSVDSWLETYYEKNSKEVEADNDYINTTWTYPEQLLTRGDLPPSLKKFQPEYFKDSLFNEWG